MGGPGSTNETSVFTALSVYWKRTPITLADAQRLTVEFFHGKDEAPAPSTSVIVSHPEEAFEAIEDILELARWKETDLIVAAANATYSDGATLFLSDHIVDNIHHWNRSVGKVGLLRARVSSLEELLTVVKPEAATVGKAAKDKYR